MTLRKKSLESVICLACSSLPQTAQISDVAFSNITYVSELVPHLKITCSDFHLKNKNKQKEADMGRIWAKKSNLSATLLKYNDTPSYCFCNLLHFNHK